MEDCKHYGTMTLTPCDNRGWEVLDWCFYQGMKIEGECPVDCPFKDMPLLDGE